MTLAKQYMKVLYKDAESYDRFIKENLIVKAKFSLKAGFYSCAYIFKDGSVAGFSSKKGGGEYTTRYEE